MEEEYFVGKNPEMKDSDNPSKPYAIFRRFDGAVDFIQAHVFEHSANVFCKILNRGNI